MSRPSVTLKLATSLDGRIATRSGESKWITGEAARAQGHRLRADHDAVLIGIGTALADDPELTVRTGEPPRMQPLRVVLDSALRLPPTARLAATSQSVSTLVICAGDADPARAEALTRAGVRVAFTQSSRSVDVREALDLLNAWRSGLRVLIEGGGAVAASFLSAGLVDRIEWFRAPIILGGDGVACIGALGFETLSSALTYRRVAVRPIERDVWESFERDPSCLPASSPPSVK
ncbi:MAG: deaminase [Alphaproteobacteria bacterium]|nr:deaminase [Alphaproteobacteria bacterium]